jgi:hypothetical protein
MNTSNDDILIQWGIFASIKKITNIPKFENLILITLKILKKNPTKNLLYIILIAIDNIIKSTSNNQIEIEEDILNNKDSNIILKICFNFLQNLIFSKNTTNINDYEREQILICYFKSFKDINEIYYNIRENFLLLCNFILKNEQVNINQNIIVLQILELLLNSNLSAHATIQILYTPIDELTLLCLNDDINMIEINEIMVRKKNKELNIKNTISEVINRQLISSTSSSTTTNIHHKLISNRILGYIAIKCFNIQGTGIRIVRMLIVNRSNTDNIEISIQINAILYDICLLFPSSFDKLLTIRSSLTSDLYSKHIPVRKISAIGIMRLLLIDNNNQTTNGTNRTNVSNDISNYDTPSSLSSSIRHSLLIELVHSVLIVRPSIVSFLASYVQTQYILNRSIYLSTYLPYYLNIYLILGLSIFLSISISI